VALALENPFTTKLKAYVKHNFDRGFCLKDEDLTKLLDFVKSRASEVKATDHILIKVYRSDSLVYESSTLELLRAEENAIRNRLTRVQVLLKHQELSVDLDFDGEEDASILRSRPLTAIGPTFYSPN